MFRSSGVILLFISLLAALGVANQPSRSISDAEAVELLYTITEVRGQPALDAMQRIREQDDKRFIAVFIETQRMMVRNSERVAHVETLEALSGQHLGTLLVRVARLVRHRRIWNRRPVSPAGKAQSSPGLIGASKTSCATTLSAPYASRRSSGAVLVSTVSRRWNTRPCLRLRTATEMMDGEPVFGRLHQRRSTRLSAADHGSARDGQ